MRRICCNGILSAGEGSGIPILRFYGIDEKKWPGVTRFKRGFGGEETAYSGTYDLPFNAVYYKAYGIARIIRRLV